MHAFRCGRFLYHVIVDVFRTERASQTKTAAGYICSTANSGLRTKRAAELPKHSYCQRCSDDRYVATSNHGKC